MRVFGQLVVTGMAMLLGACTTTSGSNSFRSADELDPDAVATFAGAADVDAYLDAQFDERDAIQQRQEAEGWEDPQSIIVTGSRIQEDVSITNTQVEGVDEGGIVKATSDFLVILRLGRVHVVRHGAESLEPLSSIDAFPPGDKNPDDTWYDEMLLHQGMIVIIGYSYGEGGTEISRFDLSGDGQLAYRDTHYLSSSDYYSSSNYASRMIGGTFFTYTPTRFNRRWREELPFLERRNPDGSRTKIGETLVPSSMGVTASLMIDPSPGVDLMHGITSCDVLSEELACSTRTVLGTSSSEYYFSRDAAYIWTGTGHDSRWGRASRNWGSTLYRLPFDTSDDITAISVQGAPVDQFSFHEDAETDRLFVMTVGDFVFENSGDFGLMMWESELAFGDAALLQIPLDGMGNGAVQLSQQQYRPLPEMNGRVQNRFVGRHLMLGTGYWGDEDEPPEFYVTPLDAQWVQRIEIPHTVSRLDRLGNDGVAIGADDSDALGFTAIEFDEDRQGGRVGSTFMLPAAEEGENRSQAFYWRPDAGNPDGGDGLMALPVDKEIEGVDFYYLGSATAMFYLERKDGALAPIGELGTEPDESVVAAAQVMEELEDAGECKASCTDWYGNSRPIFIGDRIFALMGDEIIEGTMVDGNMRELRRVNYTQ